ALAALLLEDADFRAADFALDHGHDLRVGDEWRAGENLAALVFDDQNLLERELGTRFTGRTGQGRKAARRHLDLMAAALNDCVHNRHPRKRGSVLPKWLKRKQLAPTGSAASRLKDTVAHPARPAANEARGDSLQLESCVSVVAHAHRA